MNDQCYIIISDKLYFSMNIVTIGSSGFPLLEKLWRVGSDNNDQSSPDIHDIELIKYRRLEI